ncbi:MAG TPA: C10 family peptidase [Bacteroidales bacterium]|jgi:hypothetical protein|nr:C10 family peptidase [Bacteroidales bacterium]MBP7874257.1 C10 family peptidase [Bacteroidales bacterium]MCZ2283600.1 C10 family peptidase [Bacteroidales bacterium]HNY59350.1 C10 family peptidase [Bacteroidales bacterium]HOG66422.1 C10 family peptidase [Bacteroidales bacterium]
MKLKNLFLMMMFFFGISILFAENVTVQDAERVATRFYNEKYVVNFPGEEANFYVVNNHIIDNNGLPAVYIFNFNNGGYAVVPADDRLYPVLAFSFNGAFDPENTPSNWWYVLNDYGAQVTHVRKNNVEATDRAAAAWINLRNEATGNLSFLTNIRDIPVLMTNIWNQDYPYNYLCPEDPQGPGGHVYSGCVANSMAMIMYHWRFPYTGTGSKTYYPAGYGPQTANFGESYYDYEGMVDVVGSTPNYPVALLHYHCGVAVNMMYSPNGSGAYSQDVVPAIKNYFKCSNTAQFIQRGGWPAWKAYLDQQLELEQPIYYSGQDPEGGHAFVCDGLQEQPDNTYYHFNFGWGGYMNGWYTAENAGGFNSNNAIVRNFIPDESMYPYSHPTELVTISNLVGTLDDASGPKHNYQPNVNSRWLLSPQTEYDSVSYIKINFTRFATEENADFLRIYDGEDETAPLLGEFSGTEIPGEVTSTNNKVLLVFTTDDTNEDNGWLISYKAYQPTWCSGLTNFTEPTGTFDDGSGSFYYNNGTTCMWTIQPKWANKTTISFNYFDTEDGKDLLKVYDLQSQQLLASLSGNTIPDPITSNSGKFYLVWTTNNVNRGLGWEINYEADNVGINENDDVFNNLSIYPNPADDLLNISFISKESDYVNISLINMTGIEVYKNVAHAKSTVFTNSIDLSDLAKGVYVLRLQSERKDLIRKIVVE